MAKPRSLTAVKRPSAVGENAQAAIGRIKEAAAKLGADGDTVSNRINGLEAEVDSLEAQLVQVEQEAAVKIAQLEGAVKQAEKERDAAGVALIALKKAVNRELDK